MKTISQVLEFHKAFGHPVAQTTSIGDKKTNDLRVSLIAEELGELKTALAAGDEVGTLDALADLQYVIGGAWVALGLWRLKSAAVSEVHRSNMSKLGADGRPIYREDGKILKGPNYTPPDLAQILTAGSVCGCSICKTAKD